MTGKIYYGFVPLSLMSFSTYPLTYRNPILLFITTAACFYWSVFPMNLGLLVLSLWPGSGASLGSPGRCGGAQCVISSWNHLLFASVLSLKCWTSILHPAEGFI